MHPFKGRSSSDSSAKLSRILGSDSPKAYAGGGRVKSGKAATHINIMVAPQAQDQPKPMPVPMPMAGPPPGPPPGPPLAPKPMPAPMPSGAMGMPAANAMPMRAAGGRVGSVKAEGMRNGTQVQHSDGKNDGKYISTKPPITRARGGKISQPDDGAGSGPGRIEKAAIQKRSYP